jgi:hypothetical protein
MQPNGTNDLAAGAQRAAKYTRRQFIKLPVVRAFAEKPRPPPKLAPDQFFLACDLAERMNAVIL